MAGERRFASDFSLFFARIGILIRNVNLSVICTCLYTYFKILLLQFLLEPYEFLTPVEGYEGVSHYRANGDAVQALSAIMFHTNLKKVHGPYGGGKEPNFTHVQKFCWQNYWVFGKDKFCCWFTWSFHESWSLMEKHFQIFFWNWFHWRWLW